MGGGRDDATARDGGRVPEALTNDWVQTVLAMCGGAGVIGVVGWYALKYALGREYVTKETAAERLHDVFVLQVEGDPAARKSDIDLLRQEREKLVGDTRKEIDGVGSRVNAVTDLHSRLVDRMDNVEGRTDVLEAANEMLMEPLIERFDALQTELREERDRDRERFSDWREQLARTLGGIEGELKSLGQQHKTGGR